jgi:hypothetical protein
MAENTIEQFRIETEAREWIDRVRREGHTRISGERRMNDILADIERRRGKPATDRLRQAINRELAHQRAAKESSDGR